MASSEQAKPASPEQEWEVGKYNVKVSSGEIRCPAFTSTHIFENSNGEIRALTRLLDCAQVYVRRPLKEQSKLIEDDEDVSNA